MKREGGIMRRAFCFFAVCVLSMIGVLTIDLSQAQASATGTTFYNRVSIPYLGIDLPGGVMRHIINGKGRTASSQTAHTHAAQLCYPEIRFQDLVNGKVTRTRYTSQHNGCTYVQFQRTGYNISWAKNVTQSCASLYFAGHQKARQCHYIKG